MHLEGDSSCRRDGYRSSVSPEDPSVSPVARVAREAWSEADRSAAHPPQWRGAFASLGIGLAAAVLGLLPWILTGMRLPLQNLWVVTVPPEQMPIAWLPLSQYTATIVLGMLVLGGAVAGLAARALAARLPARAPLSIAAGLLLVQIVAVAQSAQVLESGLRVGDEAAFYLLACIAVAVTGVLGGVLAFALVARAPRAGAVIGLVIGALATGWWLGALLPPFGVLSTEVAYGPLPGILRWVPAVLVGAAIAWGGVRTTGRVVAAVVGILLLWVVPALATGVTSAVGSRILLRDLPELFDYGWGVFRMALLMPELAAPPLIVALAVAAMGIVARELLARRARRGAQSDDVVSSG